jgi:hypothetical protein
MIIRNINGEIVIMNRKDFTNDSSFYKCIYKMIVPFSNLYKKHFIMNNINKNIQNE